MTEIQGTPFQLITLSVAIIAFLVQLYYYLRYYLKAAMLSQEGAAKSHNQPVSVVICARNEAENLSKYLPYVLNQKHPDFEVIVVNDCSEDDTDIVLSEFMTKYSHLKTSTIHKDSRFHHNKKLAQLIGIKAAKNELLLFTDADCRPESDAWLSAMTEPLAGNRELVLGYGGFFRTRGLLNRYIRYDSMFIAMQYSGMALRGVPYMGVGRNMAYRKELFMKSDRFSNHYHLPSGDDDLFVNAYATDTNTGVILKPEAHTRSVPANSLAEFIRQKRRHMMTAGYYSSADKVRLVTEPLSRVLMYGSLAAMASMLYMWQIALAVFIIALGIKLFVFNMAGRRFNEPGIIIAAVIFDIISPIFNTLFYITKFGKKAGRKAFR